MKNRNCTVSALVANLVVSILFGVGLNFYAAFVLKTMWNWFMPSVGLTTVLGYWAAYGIMLIFDLLTLGLSLSITTSAESKQLDNTELLTKNLALIFAKALMVSLIFGFAALIQLGI